MLHRALVLLAWLAVITYGWLLIEWIYAPPKARLLDRSYLAKRFPRPFADVVIVGEQTLGTFLIYATLPFVFGWCAWDALRDRVTQRTRLPR